MVAASEGAGVAVAVAVAVSLEVAVKVGVIVGGTRVAVGFSRSGVEQLGAAWAPAKRTVPPRLETD